MRTQNNSNSLRLTDTKHFLLIAVLWLSCDSASPGQPSPKDEPIFGTWRVIDAYVAGTVNSSILQKAVEYSLASESEISISNRRDPLRHMQVIRTPGRREINIGTDATFLPYWLELDSNFVRLVEIGEGSVSGVVEGAVVTEFMVDLNDTVLVDGADTLMFTGSMEANLVTVSEIAETMIGRSIRLVDFDVSGPFTERFIQALTMDDIVDGGSRITFNTDSTFVHGIQFGGEQRVFEGNWTGQQSIYTLDPLIDVGSGLVFERESEYEIDISADTLFLSVHGNDPCSDILKRSQSNCLEVFENSYYLQKGSITQVGYKISLTFVKQ